MPQPKSELRKILDWIEGAATRKERLYLRTGRSTNIAIETIRQYIMTRKNDSKAPGELPSLERLSEFWRPLVLQKASFRDEKDYYASIRVLCLLQDVIAELLTPYIMASMIATKRPGEMQALEHEIELGVAEGLGTEHATAVERLKYFPSAPEIPEVPPSVAAEIRKWRQESPVFRCLMLLRLVDRMEGNIPLQYWLQSPTVLLDGETPVAKIADGKWADVANYIDDLLTGNSK